MDLPSDVTNIISSYAINHSHLNILSKIHLHFGIYLFTADIMSSEEIEQYNNLPHTNAEVFHRSLLGVIRISNVHTIDKVYDAIESCLAIKHHFYGIYPACGYECGEESKVSGLRG